MRQLLPIFGAFASMMTSCKQPADALELKAENFDTVANGQTIALYTLKNNNGMTVQITNYGGRIATIIVPDRDGNPTDVVWGYESIEEYFASDDVYAGPLVGRYGNRIEKGSFSIDDNAYQVSINNGPNHLHGGNEGFWNKVWSAEPFTNDNGEQTLRLSYLSPDGEDGYPGNLMTIVEFTLTKDNSLRLDYTATTDKPTVCNPTSHPYFNLHGTTKKSTNSHLLTVNADYYTPTDSTLIPTGKILPVEGTVADFREPHTIGERQEVECDINRFGGGGYDLNFVINKNGDQVEQIATLYEPENGIAMDILTDQPGLQFYSGTCMNGTDIGKRGDLHCRYSGLALETQHYPDSPNKPQFPSTILRPGETYKHTAVYKFSVR